MTDETWLNGDKTPDKNEVAIDYIKSSDFRTVWVDGAIGSVTALGKIHFALYSERPALPRRQVFKFEPSGENGGKLGVEVIEKQISRGSVVREMSCDVFLDVETAKNLAKFLLDHVNILDKLGSQS